MGCGPRRGAARRPPTCCSCRGCPAAPRPAAIGCHAPNGNRTAAGSASRPSLPPPAAAAPVAVRLRPPWCREPPQTEVRAASGPRAVTRKYFSQSRYITRLRRHAAFRSAHAPYGKKTSGAVAVATAAAMIPPPDSLLRYNPPMLVSRRTEKRSPEVSGAGRSGLCRAQPAPTALSPQALPLKAIPQPSPPPGPVPPSRPRTAAAAASAKEPQEILNAILPPR